MSGEDGSEAGWLYKDVGRWVDVVGVRVARAEASKDKVASRGFEALFQVGVMMSRVLERRYRDGGEDRKGWEAGDDISGSVGCLEIVSRAVFADLGMGK